MDRGLIGYLSDGYILGAGRKGFVVSSLMPDQRLQIAMRCDQVDGYALL